MAQNIPDLLTVSLHTEGHTNTTDLQLATNTCGQPAVDSDGVVPSSPLYLGHLLHHSAHTVELPTAAIWGPVGDVELTHLVGLPGLHGQEEEEEQIERGS